MVYLMLAAVLALAVPAAAADAGSRWYERIEFGGSAKVRYQWISNENPSPPHPRDRNLWRYQVVFGGVLRPDSEIEVGLRLASSGNSGLQPDVRSQYVTLDDAFRDDPLWIDVAYIRYAPDWPWLQDRFGLSATAGKFQNPYRSLPLLWDADITPEGVYTLSAPPAWKAWRVEFVRGFHMLSEEDQGALAGFAPGADAYLLASQMRAGRDGVLRPGLDVDVWTSYYQYVRPSLVLARPAAALGTGNNSLAGNRLASEFGVVDVGAVLSFHLWGMPATAAVQWARNMRARAVPATGRVEDDLWTVQATLGRIRGKGDWTASVLWGSIDADAVPDFFVEGNWGAGLGSTNFDGVRLAAEYAVTRAATFGVTYFGVQERARRRLDPDQDLILVDFGVKF
jgi:hypothetical protein